MDKCASQEPPLFGLLDTCVPDPAEHRAVLVLIEGFLNAKLGIAI